MVWKPWKCWETISATDILKKITVYEWHEKNYYGGTCFNSRKEIMEKSKTTLMAIPTIEFQKCFESWIKRWHKCVAIDGWIFRRGQYHFWWIKLVFWIFWMNSGNFLIKIFEADTRLIILPSWKKCIQRYSCLTE